MRIAMRPFHRSDRTDHAQPRRRRRSRRRLRQDTRLRGRSANESDVGSRPPELSAATYRLFAAIDLERGDTEHAALFLAWSPDAREAGIPLHPRRRALRDRTLGLHRGGGRAPRDRALRHRQRPGHGARSFPTTPTRDPARWRLHRASSTTADCGRAHWAKPRLADSDPLRAASPRSPSRRATRGSDGAMTTPISPCCSRPCGA